jgi:hypothetical protein
MDNFFWWFLVGFLVAALVDYVKDELRKNKKHD